MTPAPQLESHWQRGCNDAKAAVGPKRPFPDTTSFSRPHYLMRLANEGYMNGYRFGCQSRHAPAFNEGSEC